MNAQALDNWLQLWQRLPHSSEIDFPSCNAMENGLANGRFNDAGKVNEGTMPQRHDRGLQIKFGGRATEGNVVSVAVLTQSLQSLQRVVHLLGMRHEGREIRQRARPSIEIEKRYAVLCQLPKEGSFVAPVMIRDTSRGLFGPDAVEAVLEDLHGLLSAITDQDTSRTREALPDPNYRAAVLEALRKMTPPKRAGIEVALQSSSGEDLFVPDRVADFLDNLVERHAGDVTVTAVIGRLIGIDFDRRRLRLHYPPTRRELHCFYQPDIEDMLLENTRDLIQVVGQVIIDANGEPERINDVEKIIEVDLSVIDVEGFEVGDKRIVAKQPVIFQPLLDDTSQYYAFQEAPFGIQLLAIFRDQLETDLYDELDFLWRQYAEESDEKLSKGAQQLKRQLLDAFQVAR